MSRRTFIIVGAGLAGAKAAEELRGRGFDGRVVLIGSEPERPYERPPLTKDYLRGESEREKAYVHEQGFYEQHEVELLADTTATAIDPGASRVTLADGRELDYDRLLLTTGAEPRRLPVPGAELDGVYYLRTLADCDALRERLESGGHVVVVGAGWIGSEFAASARQRGLEVTVIDPLALPNERIFGAEIGAFYRDVHRDHGVELVLGEGVEAFEGEGAVARVRSSGGRVLDCDFAVVGIGVVPRVQLAGDAGLTIDNGILVDEKLQSLGAERVRGRRCRERVASVLRPADPRRALGQRAASGADSGASDARRVGQLRPYSLLLLRPVRSRHGVLGYATSWDQVVFRGDRDAGEFIAFWLRDGRVVAGMNVNVWDVNEHVQALIRSRQTVDVAALTDPGGAPRIACRRANHWKLTGGTNMAPNPKLQRLHDAGVSIWLDTLSRQLLQSGEFAELIRDYSVTGATSNPTIFAKAITGSDLYDEQLRALVADGQRDTQELFFALALDDVREAARLLRPDYDAHRGHGRLHLVRVHARSGRRHRCHDLPGDRALAAARISRT